MSNITPRPDLSFTASAHGWRFSVIECASKDYFEVAIIDAAGELRHLSNEDTVAVLRRDQTIILLAALITIADRPTQEAVDAANTAIECQEDGVLQLPWAQERAVLRTLFHYFAKSGYGVEAPTAEVGRAAEEVDYATLTKFIVAMIKRPMQNDLVPSRVDCIREWSGL